MKLHGKKVEKQKRVLNGVGFRDAGMCPFSICMELESCVATNQPVDCVVVAIVGVSREDAAFVWIVFDEVEAKNLWRMLRHL